MRERQDDSGGQAPRRGYLKGERERAANDGGGLVVVSIAELREAIRDAVAEATEGQPRAGARLLDRQGLADGLACSVAQVDKMRRAGMPCLYVGESPRFVFDDCVRWLADQPKQKAES